MNLSITMIMVIISAVMVLSVVGVFFMQGSNVNWFDHYTIAQKCEQFRSRILEPADIEREDPEFAAKCRKTFGLAPRQCVIKYCAYPMDINPCVGLCNQVKGMSLDAQTQMELCAKFKENFAEWYGPCECSNVVTLC